MKNYTSYSSPLNWCTQGEYENARPMGLGRTHVNSETGKAWAEFRVHSHQEDTYAVYWSMSQSHQCTSRTEIHRTHSIQYLKQVVSAARSTLVRIYIPLW